MLNTPKIRRLTKEGPKVIRLKAVIVPGIGGQFEGKVMTPDECVLKIQATRSWFSQDELDAIESFVSEVAERKGRPALKVVG